VSVIDRARRILRGRNARVVLPEGEDPRIVEAAAILRRTESVRAILLGDVSRVQAVAAALDLDAGELEVVEPASRADASGYAALYQQARPGTRSELARRIVGRPLFHAGLMVRAGDADTMVAGATCPTARVIEAALMTIGLAPGVASPSSSFLMTVGDAAGGTSRSLLFADCALNVDPSAEVLADIGLAAARTMVELTGETPRVAFLSFSTRGSARHARVDRVRTAVELARARAPGLAIDGELQADAALSPRVARLKAGDDDGVAGRANVLVFPDLDSANIGYKLVQYLGGAQALGPLLQGFATPVSDLSRGASVADVVAIALLTLGRAHARSASGT
jgi:phosphate acetyltransferase